MLVSSSVTRPAGTVSRSSAIANSVRSPWTSAAASPDAPPSTRHSSGAVATLAGADALPDAGADALAEPDADPEPLDPPPISRTDAPSSSPQAATSASAAITAAPAVPLPMRMPCVLSRGTVR